VFFANNVRPLRRHSFYPLNYGGYVLLRERIVFGDRPLNYLDSSRIASSRPLIVSGYMRWLTSC
jgi:hypothetical protein